MANKRMFSKQVTTSDAFMDMPVSSQLLYFHLNMEADDDGFVANPKRIMRMLNVGEDDLKILLAKRFLLAFESGVVVIKHWLLHNAVRKDMYKETQYLDEKKGLKIKDNGVYTESRNESVTSPLHRLDKVRLGKDRIDKNKPHATRDKKVVEYTPLGAEVLKAFEGVDPKNKGYYANTTQRAACDFLISEYGLEEVLKRISVLSRTNKVPYFPSITTPFQLKEKWVQLQDKVEQKRGELKAKEVKVI